MHNNQFPKQGFEYIIFSLQSYVYMFSFYAGQECPVISSLENFVQKCLKYLLCSHD